MENPHQDKITELVLIFYAHRSVTFYHYVNKGKDASKGDEIHQCPHNVIKSVVKIIKERLVESGLTSRPADVEARKREAEFQGRYSMLSLVNDRLTAWPINGYIGAAVT